MIGMNIAEGAHYVNVLPPQSISGGKTSSYVNMGKAKHLSLILSFGAFGTNKPDPITVVAAKDKNGTGATAIPFRYYMSKAGGIEITSPPTVATASGIAAAALSKINNEFIIIEIDADEIHALGDSSNTSDYPYIAVVVADSGNTTYMHIGAILSGLRQAYQGGVDATS